VSSYLRGDRWSILSCQSMFHSGRSSEGVRTIFFVSWTPRFRFEGCRRNVDINLVIQAIIFVLNSKSTWTSLVCIFAKILYYGPTIGNLIHYHFRTGIRSINIASSTLL
jgi:hypothetical protein